MGSNSSKTTKEERQNRNSAIDNVTTSAVDAIDQNTQQYAETILNNAQRDGNDQPIIRSEDRDYMQTQFMINETKKKQLERKTDPFTKTDLIAILARLNGLSDVQAMQFDKLTVPDLRAAVRQYIYNPNVINSASSNTPSTIKYVRPPPLQIKNAQRSDALVPVDGNSSALDIVLRR
jgi:hypothetical protein